MPDSSGPTQSFHHAYDQPGRKKSQNSDDNSPGQKKIAEPQFGSSQEREEVHSKDGFSISLASKQARPIIRGSEFPDRLLANRSMQCRKNFFVAQLET
jgi:hypothetical protein